MLVPEIAQGAAPELDELRAACRTAIVRAHGPDRQWTLVGPGPTQQMFGPTARGTFAGLGVPLEVALGWDRPGPAELPLPLTVGAYLLHDAVGTDDILPSAVTVTAEAEHRFVADQFAADRDIALLVVGDGSARRGIKAPGYLDERAAAFDAGVGHALATGDAAALAALDPELGSELLAAGVPAWRAVASALTEQEWDARLLHTSAPYGVAYFAAVWTARG